MRVLTKLLMCFCSLMMVSCSCHELPPVKDAEALRKDCAILLNQFPPRELPTNEPNQQLGIRPIPKAKWLSSIQALQPSQVYSYGGGILLWIDGTRSMKDIGKYWNGYYIIVNPELPAPPQAATNHFVFSPTKQDGIHLMKQEKF
jgi:hypothetical protein